MGIPVRLPVSRDTRRLPNSSPGHGNSSAWGTRMGNSTVVFDPEENARPDRIDPATTSFWEALAPTEQEALRSLAFRKTFTADERLMKEGDPADYVIVIEQGRAMICVDENGWERVLAERGPGELVGERGGLQVRVRSASVIAIGPVHGLVVTTEDFSAFVAAHPRVLEIVEGQVYDRLTEGMAGHRDRREGPSTFRVVSRDMIPAIIRPSPLSGQNCTVLLTDVVGFSSPNRTDKDRRIIREALFDMTQMMLRGIVDVRSEDRGDGMLTVVWPGIPTATVVDRLLKEMLPALGRHNSIHSDSARIQLRVAIDVGPVVSDIMGVSGETIITIARLVEAPRFKKAMDTSGASLGIMATTFIYETVIKHDPSLAGYCQVRVNVKKFNRVAWMRVFDAAMSPHMDPCTAVAC
jgi:CRP-like cAMP-binding protein